MFHLKETELIDELDGIITSGDFYSRAYQEGTHLLFLWKSTFTVVMVHAYQQG